MIAQFVVSPSKLTPLRGLHSSTEPTETAQGKSVSPVLVVSEVSVVLVGVWLVSVEKIIQKLTHLATLRAGSNTMRCVTCTILDIEKTTIVDQKSAQLDGLGFDSKVKRGIACTIPNVKKTTTVDQKSAQLDGLGLEGGVYVRRYTSDDGLGTDGMVKRGVV